jgi:hypothetical protein
MKQKLSQNFSFHRTYARWLWSFHTACCAGMTNSMRRHLLSVVLSILTIGVGGCASTPHAPAPAPASRDWPLLSPASLQQTVQVTQVLRGDVGESGDQTFTLRAVVTVNAQQLTVIGLTAMGLRAFKLQYDGQNLTEERAPQVPEALDSRQLLNDLQLAYWPLPVLQAGWQAAGGEVREPWPGTRRLYRAGQLLAEVHYAADPWQGRLWLRHFDFPYSLVIESTPLVP